MLIFPSVEFVSHEDGYWSQRRKSSNYYDDTHHPRWSTINLSFTIRFLEEFRSKKEKNKLNAMFQCHQLKNSIPVFSPVPQFCSFIDWFFFTHKNEWASFALKLIWEFCICTKIRTYVHTYEYNLSMICRNQWKQIMEDRFSFF